MGLLTTLGLEFIRCRPDCCLLPAEAIEPRSSSEIIRNNLKVCGFELTFVTGVERVEVIGLTKKLDTCYLF